MSFLPANIYLDYLLNLRHMPFQHLIGQEQSMFGAYGLRVWLMVLIISVKRLIISGIQRVNQYDLTQIVQNLSDKSLSIG